jgi:hypothetical protein
MLELNAPHSPLSELATTSRWTWSLAGAGEQLGAASLTRRDLAAEDAMHGGQRSA